MLRVFLVERNRVLVVRIPRSGCGPGQELVCVVMAMNVASGWMRIRQRVRQRGVELPLIISDHADWDELTKTVREVAPTELWITHGRDDALMRWAELNHMTARPLRLVGYEDENE